MVMRSARGAGECAEDTREVARVRDDGGDGG